MAVNAYLINSNIARNRLFAHQINMAGKQRMLSQKLVSRALWSARANLRDPMLTIEADQWHQMHLALQQGSEKEQLPPQNNPNIINMFADLNPLEAKMYNTVKATEDKVPGDSLVNTLMEMQANYLVSMNEIVSAMERDAESQLVAVANKQALVAIISGLVLILEILVLVVPFHRKLIISFKQAKIQGREIQEQKEEIAQQNHTLEEQYHRLEEYDKANELTLNAINAGVWKWNILTNEENWSLRFFTLLGYNPGELPATFDTFMNVLLHPDDVAPVQQAIADHLEKDIPYRLNIRMRNKNGAYRWYETSGKADRDDTGKPVSMAGSIIDNDDKINYQQELENTIATKDKLFAIVAHDLRSPLAGLGSLVELQGDGTISQDEFMQYVGKLKDNLTFLQETLDNVLHWAMSQMNGFSRTPELLNMRELIASVQRFYKTVADQKNITITQTGTGVQVITADKNHILLALRNLLSNALKFTPEGGAIHITTTTTKNAHTIAIQDSGVGMTEDEITNALQLKGNYTTRGTNGERGTGLGLNLCQAVVRENGGTLSITSSPGEGTTATLSFPQQATN
jgi:PAS domain S-box-containing protein